MTTVYVPAIASCFLCISLILYTLGLFSNYWVYKTISDTKNQRFGLYETCAKGSGCSKFVDKEALTFEMVAFVLHVETLIFMIYLILQKSKLEDGSFKYKLRFLFLLYVLIAITHITGWAKFAESKRDFASEYTKAGYSNYLVLIAFILNLVTLILIGLAQFISKAKIPLLVIVSLTVSIVAVTLFGVGLFTNFWIVGTDKNPLKPYNTGFFGKCALSICDKDFYVKTNTYLALELTGFVVLLSATLLSVLLAFFRIVFAEEQRFLKWVITLALNLIALAFIIAGWASFAVYKNKDTEKIFEGYKFDWSFYIIIGTIISGVISAIVCAIEVIKNKEK